MLSNMQPFIKLKYSIFNIVTWLETVLDGVIKRCVLYSVTWNNYVTKSVEDVNPERYLYVYHLLSLVYYSTRPNSEISSDQLCCSNPSNGDGILAWRSAFKILNYSCVQMFTTIKTKKYETTSVIRISNLTSCNIFRNLTWLKRVMDDVINGHDSFVQWCYVLEDMMYL